MQATRVRWEGPGSEAGGTVIYRTLFGIRVGKDFGGGVYHLDFRAWFSVWIGFLLVEALAGTYLIWRLIRIPKP